MDNSFTFEDQRSIEQMLNEYEIQKEKVKQLDAENLSKEDEELLAEFNKGTEFLAEARKALDFTKSSTMEVADGNMDVKCATLFRNESEYAEAAVTLTGGFNKRMEKALEETRIEPFSSEFMNKNEYNATVKAPLENDTIKAAVKEEIGGSNVMTDRTVADVLDVVEYTKELREQNYIKDENVIDDTLSAFFAENEADNLHTISVDYFEPNKEADKEKETEREPVQITESNDGFVMNTNQEITAENEKEFNQKVENKDEVIHNEAPSETTIDTAEVKGKVKYEENDDIGTVEKKQGIPTYEEKADKEDEVKAQIDNESKKKKSRSEEREM